MCFLSGASLSNTHKNKYWWPWEKQVSLMGRMLRREPLPGHPIYAMAAHTLIFQHRSIHVTETCPAVTQVALLELHTTSGRRRHTSSHFSPYRSRPHMV